jgi:hypothetical protein
MPMMHDVMMYLLGRIEATWMALADTGDTVRSFRQDADAADLELCLAKCTLYMPGIPKGRAH